jgi:uroporphyrinogen-III synthase
MPNLPVNKTYALFSNPASRKIVARLEQNGARVFQFAPIQVEKINFQENLNFINDQLTKFDWLIFPDVFTVDFFLEILEESEIDVFDLDSIRVLAFGEAVADRLRFAQLHADIIAQTNDISIVFNLLASYLETDKLEKFNFLISKESKFENGLMEKLMSNGANAVELSVYKTEIIESNKVISLRALLYGGAIDEFIFTKPEDITFINKYLYPIKPAQIFTETKIYGINEITVQTLSEFGLRAKLFK